MSISKEKAVEELKNSILVGLHNLIEGADNDIREFALDLANYGVKVAAEPDPKIRQKLLKSLRSQAKMLAEVNRIRVVNEGHATVERVLVTAVSLLGGVLVKSAVPPPA
jgi:hypothetical protein